MEKVIGVAIIDNGINSKLLKKQVHNNLTIGISNQVQIDNSCLDEIQFLHGTNCALIIEKYNLEANLHSIRILDDSGRGIIDKLQPALEWCYQNNIQLVNLSLGSTYFQDKPVIRNVINHYANKGMIIVSAAANSGHMTYPASFTNVIGVAAGEKFEVDIELQKQKGIDFVALSNHEIVIERKVVRLQSSNSYAAPYVTAKIGKILKNGQNDNVCLIRQKLLPEAVKTKFYYQPDWIEAAWVTNQCKESKAQFYFKEIKGELEYFESMIDTIVVKEKEEFLKYHNKKKHIVYLGNEPVMDTLHDRYFWSKKERICQIIGSQARKADIDIPVIVINFDKNQDMIFWLCKLKNCFWKDGYNVYIMSSKIESILYDLEYLPEELCSETSMEQVHNFIFWQTYYYQSDVILIGMNKNDNYYLNPLENISDMVIEIRKKAGDSKAEVYCGGKLKEEVTFQFNDQKPINILYQKIIKLFTEDINE